MNKVTSAFYRERGKMAFQRGFKAAAQDPFIRDSLKGKEPGSSVKELKAYTEGFEKARRKSVGGLN
jgi:hypothetical protein